MLCRKRRGLPYISLAYLPLNHVAGLLNLLSGIAQGGILHFPASSDMSTILEDARLSRPTFVLLVPRLADLILEEFESACLRAGATDEGARDAVMVSLRYKLLGERLLWLMVSTAPVTAKTKRFLIRCFNVPVFDAYGQTEGGGQVSIDSRINRDFISDYKLVSVPELGYTTADKPYPRGALCVKSRMSINAYYKNESATKALFDEEGYLLTGDIVEERAPDMVFIIDRQNNVVKTSQGQAWRGVAHVQRAAPPCDLTPCACRPVSSARLLASSKASSSHSPSSRRHSCPTAASSTRRTRTPPPPSRSSWRSSCPT